MLSNRRTITSCSMIETIQRMLNGRELRLIFRISFKTDFYENLFSMNIVKFLPRDIKRVGMSIK